MNAVRFLPAGDSAVSVELGGGIDPETGARVSQLAVSLTDAPLKGQRELVPSYRALMVCFDPSIISLRALLSSLKRRVRKLPSIDPVEWVSRILSVPVCYGGIYGPDLSDVARHTGFSEGEVVKRHSDVLYRIYMLGFLPGFPYLGGLDPALETPRLETPRTEIPPGAVGIGGTQTGIYPLRSPGGWRLIGQTPMRPYDPMRIPAILYRAGDLIRFQPIDEAAYSLITEQVALGQYEPVWTEGKAIYSDKCLQTTFGNREGY